ncbi:hypothetical protein KCP75_02580 [Salmonella enterica subsp. enterica]|nr:hypothetical protein KCP75_02580 [Salmonella enterica subsp. enterica]
MMPRQLKLSAHCLHHRGRYAIWRRSARTTVHFVQCSLEEALSARHERQRYLGLQLAAASA